MRRLSAFAILLLMMLPAALRAQDAEPPDSWRQRLWDVQPIRDERIALRSDFLYWFLNKLNVPPLVTTGPAGSQAVIGDPGTEILRGDGRLTSRHDRYVGARFGGDAWLSRDSLIGLDWSITLLERDSSNITYQPHTITPLARPYMDATTGQWKSFIVAGNSPDFGPVSGSINVYSRIEFFDQDINAKVRLATGERYLLNLLAGAHFIQMRERLDITGTSRILPVENVLIGVVDHFQTFDKFFGGQLGLSGEWQRGRWSLAGKGVIALGGDDQQIHNKGDRVFNTPLARTTQDFGLYVLPSNTGQFERGAFDMVSEWELTLGLAITSRFRLRFGYTLLTWSNPVRPGDQIEPLNLSQIAPGGLVGPLRPTVPFRTDSFWAQGLHWGGEFKW